MMRNIIGMVALAGVCAGCAAAAESDGWYTQGTFAPVERYPVSITNTLNIDRTDCPVTITRDQFPVKDLHEMWVTVVDPSLLPSPEPTKEVLARYGYHQIRAEANGHIVFHQMDDIDKDGVWDELFFQTNLKANETKTIYVYMGMNDRGWNPHGTHAELGSYCRHIVPFWESKYVGWKLWFPTSCDVYGKRVPQLMSSELSRFNYDGYGVPADMGSDIQDVAGTLGGGGICLFEYPANPDTMTTPRYTPAREAQGVTGTWNGGQISDTRYAYDVVVNGPVRSMIRVHTFNWDSGMGCYELEQLYTAYTNQNYSTCKVTYTQFLPRAAGVMFGCGIRKKANEGITFQNGGVVISGGSEEVVNPDDVDGIQKLTVDFVGKACVVKDSYHPQYVLIPGREQNHTFRIPVTDDRTFEYMIFATWSEGEVLKTPEAFKTYVLKTAEEYNNPVRIDIGIEETRAGK